MGVENTEEKVKRGRGRPKKFDGVEGFRKAVEGYIADCTEKNIFPDEAGMRLALKYSKRWADMMISENENPESWREYRDIFEYAKDNRESFLVRKMTSDNKAAQGCLNALKQAANGGYLDRPADSGKIELNIKVDGIGGMEMFK